MITGPESTRTKGVSERLKGDAVIQGERRPWGLKALVLFGSMIVGGLLFGLIGYLTGSYIYDLFPEYFNNKYAGNFPSNLISKVRGCAIMDVTVFGTGLGLLLSGTGGCYKLFFKSNSVDPPRLLDVTGMPNQEKTIGEEIHSTHRITDNM